MRVVNKKERIRSKRYGVPNCKAQICSLCGGSLKGENYHEKFEGKCVHFRCRKKEGV